MPTLITCPACKKKVSDEANVCPSCGQPITEEIRAAAEKAKKRKGVGCLVVIGIFLAICFAAAMSDVKDRKQTDNKAATPSAQQATSPQQASLQPQKPEIIPTFPQDIDGFIKAFNANTRTIDKNYPPLKKLADTTNTSDTLVTIQARITKNHQMVLTSDKATGTLKDVTLISGSDKPGIKEITEMMVAWASIIKTLAPDLVEKERGAILKELGLIGADGIASNGEAIRKDVRFWQRNGSGLGIWFGAEAR